MLLVFAAAVSALTAEWVDSLIVLLIVLATVGIGYYREYSAQSAAEALQARVKSTTKVLRDRQAVTIPVDEVAPGDIVLLAAGSLVPADAVILESTDCFISEAALTGESFPVEKRPGTVRADAPLVQRTNCVFLGTNVRSGTALCVVVNTGRATQFGTIAHRLTLRPPETEFDRGIRRFGYLVTTAMLIMVLVVFVAHMLRGRPPVETLLFSIALAVGLSPELLPAILSVNLSRGAQLMANRGVLVRRLNAIENLGSVDILCTDKTGTLTEGVVSVEGAYAEDGTPSDFVLELAARNAALQAGLTNPLDEAILKAHGPDLTSIEKLAEIPFDFTRKRLSVIIQSTEPLLIMKGAFHHVMEVCSQTFEGTALDSSQKDQLEAHYTKWSSRGIRVIAVATRSMERKPVYNRDDEKDMRFVGFVTFLDRPKEGVAKAISDLSALGVSIKLITGDNKLVAQNIAAAVGLRTERTLSGEDLEKLHDEALWQLAERTDLFVEVDPNEKERIILSLKKMGHVVGFLGDGVNDAPAMHAADTSLSVEDAVDVAKDAADFVLLQRDLDVIRGGIEEGRKTFANTLKYILITTSANLGNMLSMAAASLFLPFLPLLASQILLNNFLSDVPAIGIADDAVDRELVHRPRRWNMRFIGKFMVVFGLTSSLFDFLTFGSLLKLFHATPVVFRTGWFIESLLTELVIALVVRTRRPFYRSRPGKVLFYSTLLLIGFTFLIPFLPFSAYLGFVPLPAAILLTLVTLTIFYVIVTEAMKRWFYRSHE
jgi:Mg2+-importing ATPase